MIKQTLGKPVWPVATCIAQLPSCAHQHALLAFPIDAVPPFNVEFHQFQSRLRYDDDVLRVTAVFDAIELLRRRPAVHSHESVSAEFECTAPEQHVAQTALGHCSKRCKRIG